MAIIKTNFMTGAYQVPSCSEPGEVYEITAKIPDTLRAGDIIQVMQLPGRAVITDIRLGVLASMGLTEVAAGIATDSTSNTLAKTFISATTMTTTDVVRCNTSVMADVPMDAPTVDDRIVAIVVSVEGDTRDLYCTVQYRSALYDK
jgi:hypothetical protein